MSLLQLKFSSKVFFMAANNTTQWSSKFKKFGITDPFLKLLTVKYENSITWPVVKDELTLNQHIKDVPFPLAKVQK